MERLLETSHFKNSRRYPALFRFIVEETLEGRGEFLKERLAEDANDPRSVHDFGKNIIPGTIRTGRVYAYPFQDVKTAAQAYWRDVGTVDAFFEANMELVYVTPELNLYDEDWPIWTYQEHVPSAKFVLDEDGRRGEAINSLVSGGCIISGATVREALVRYEPRIDVLAVDASPAPGEPTVLLIRIDYRIRANNARANLVYPFFITEGM